MPRRHRPNLGPEEPWQIKSASRWHCSVPKVGTPLRTSNSSVTESSARWKCFRPVFIGWQKLRHCMKLNWWIFKFYVPSTGFWPSYWRLLVLHRMQHAGANRRPLHSLRLPASQGRRARRRLQRQCQFRLSRLRRGNRLPWVDDGNKRLHSESHRPIVHERGPGARVL